MIFTRAYLSCPRRNLCQPGRASRGPWFARRPPDRSSHGARFAHHLTKGAGERSFPLGDSLNWGCRDERVPRGSDHGGGPEGNGWLCRKICFYKNQHVTARYCAATIPWVTMPPRTTQQSQKSQIEPWLAHRPRILLVGVSEPRGSCTHGIMETPTTHRRLYPSCAHAKHHTGEKGSMTRICPPLRLKGKTFS